MTNESPRWTLAFDATCGTCRRVSRLVAQASGGKLRVVPLGRPEVKRWRAAAFGDDPPWAPTLLRVTGATAKGWTGAAMAVPLIRRLGIRSTLRVVYALGRFTDPESELPSSAPRSRRSPAAPLMRLGLGMLTSAWLLLAGKPPIKAADENAAAIRWAREHRDRLPLTYEEVAAYPQAYQKAIFTESPPPVQSALWISALEHERRNRSELSPSQDRVFAEAIELASIEDVLVPDLRRLDTELDGRLARLREDAVREFTDPREYRLIVSLGG